MHEIAIITAFPSMFGDPFAEGMIRIACERSILKIRTVDLRNYTTDRHRSVDDAPYGGGAGMILKAEPVAKALEDVEEASGERAVRLLLGPQGERFDQRMAREFAETARITLVSGRYKDVDDRVRGLVDREVSIGDYVLAGGELAAMVIVDAVARLLPGVVGDPESVDTDSFETGRLDAPYYTRPERFEGTAVPDVLLSGHHAQIEAWRTREALKRTLLLRPELLERTSLTDEEVKLLPDIAREVAEIADTLIKHREGRD